MGTCNSGLLDNDTTVNGWDAVVAGSAALL